LARSEILDAGMRAFKRRLLAIREVFAMGFDALVNEKNSTVLVPYLPLSANEPVTRNAGDSLLSLAGNTTLSYKSVTIGSPSFIGLKWDDQQAARDRFFRPEDHAELAMENLLRHVVRTACGLLTPTNFGSGTAAVVLGNVDDFSAVETNKLRRLCNEAEWPDRPRTLLLAPTADEALANNTPTMSTQVGDSIFAEGAVNRVSGFDVRTLASLPHNSVGLVGAALYPSAVLIGFATITPSLALQTDMVDFQLLTDEETGIEVAFKHVADGNTGQEVMGFEISFGVGVGETAAAQLVVVD
jgi:hypothetical protein